MFSLNLKRNKNFRNLLSAYMPEIVPCSNLSSKIDPGARRRLRLIEGTDEKDAESLDYEANFEFINQTHKELVREMNIMREKLQYNIVKQRYFKTNYPNFLTWHDKEQIRLLHTRDPEEWSITKLSEGFPALPEIIKKILKSNWSMENKEKMKSHDEKVQENWKKFRNNELNNLPERLVNHLQKFSSREFNYHNYENTCTNDEIEVTITHNYTEFSEIISSYHKLKNKDKGNAHGKNIAINLNNSKRVQDLGHNWEENYVGKSRNMSGLTTLSSLKNQVKNDFEKGNKISDTDVDIFRTIELKDENLPTKPEAIDQLDYHKYNTGKLMVVDGKKHNDYSHLAYPEKIQIPKDIYKRKCTYKLNDCYYDCNGRFLYRVPGMF